MSKPAGIEFGLRDGCVTLGVRLPTGMEDRIWDVVEEAINGGVTVEQFRRECAHAWADTLRKHAEYAERDWAK